MSGTWMRTKKGCRGRTQWWSPACLLGKNSAVDLNPSGCRGHGLQSPTGSVLARLDPTTVPKHSGKVCPRYTYTAGDPSYERFYFKSTARSPLVVPAVERQLVGHWVPAGPTVGHWRQTPY